MNSNYQSTGRPRVEVDGPGLTEVMHPNVEDIVQILRALPHEVAVKVLAEAAAMYRGNLLEEAGKAREYAEELLRHATNLEQSLEFKSPLAPRAYEHA